MPKSRVTCVMQRSDTFEKHQSSSVPIFQPNVSNFSTFQFWSLSIVGSFSVFCLSSELCFTIKTQKKRKNFPLSVFREVIHICLSFAFRCQIPSLLCVGTLASSLLSFLLNLLVDVGCVFSTELYTLTADATRWLGKAHTQASI